jgi:hypothetical protein
MAKLSIVVLPPEKENKIKGKKTTGFKIISA